MQQTSLPPAAKTGIDRPAATDPAWIRRELERLDVLVPEIDPAAPRDLPALALAWVERYEGDVLQLALEWEFLYVALQEAWRRGADTAVIRLVEALAHAAGRRTTPAVAEHILSLGIEACRRTGDREHLARFLNRLSGLLCARGKYRQGQRLWQTSLEVSGPLGPARGLWEPLANVVQIVDIVGSYPAAQQLVEAVRQTDQEADAEGHAAVLFVRAFYARVSDDIEQAQDDLRGCLQLLARPALHSTPPAYRQLFSLILQGELARMQGNYERFQAYTETALQLARVFGDSYSTVDLLMDQATFAAYKEQFSDTETALRRLADTVQEGENGHLAMRCRLFERHLSAYVRSVESAADRDHRVRRLTILEPLSDRETEVLQLVAAGLGNQEIARRLVVTPGTVKKHLEHIYSKLDVHSRTAAVARGRALQILG